MEDTTGHQSANPSIKGSSKAVLVTGGAGYVGSHTCKLLAKNGYVPVTVDRHLQRRTCIFRTKLRSESATGGKQTGRDHNKIQHNKLHTFRRQYKCILRAVANPSMYYKNNLIMTVSLLDKLIECGVKTFVYSSSAATYGDPGLKKCKETDVCNPINSYGATKLMMEQLCRDYKTHTDYPVWD